MGIGLNGVKNSSMKKEIKNGVFKGYEIGGSISVHGHINDPESWFITIRSLQIFGHSLCRRDCTEDEIVRCINVLLQSKLNVIKDIMLEIDND